MRRLLIAISVLLLVACQSNKAGPTTLNQTEPIVQTGQQAAASPEESAHAPLSQQKQCADQAKRAFDESYNPVKDGMNYEFTSHFDSKANICYILVHAGGVSFGNPASNDLVFDAYEGRGYASYVWINTTKKKYWEIAPTECSVKPRNNEEIFCHSQDEFDSLIDKYFGIGR
jgi:hypothetical protein